MSARAMTTLLLLGLVACSGPEVIDPEDVPVAPSFWLRDGDTYNRTYQNNAVSTELIFLYRNDDSVDDYETAFLKSKYPTSWDIWKPSGDSAFTSDRAFRWHQAKLEWASVGTVVPETAERANGDVLYAPDGATDIRFRIFVPAASVDLVEERQQYPRPIVKPAFYSKRAGKVAYDCDVDVRAMPYRHAHDLIGPYNDINWRSANQTTASLSYRLFFDFDRNTWSASAPSDASPSPRDINEDGDVWDKIDSGSDNFICLESRPLIDISYHNRAWVCTDGLDLRTGERKAVDLPDKIAVKVMDGPRVYEVTRPLLRYENISQTYVPGETTATIGSCKRVD